MSKKFLSLILFSIIFLFTARSQELVCKVTVDYQRIQGTNTSVFKTLENSLNEFINAQQWTQQSYKEREKIECSMLIIINSSQSNNSFSASLTVQARRPVFNTNYNTTLLNYMDKDFNFVYNEFDPLRFNENTFSNNLTSVIAFWAYMIIGLDNDSYSSLGGTSIIQQAERVVNNAQGKDQLGWEPNQSNRNRYWVTEQLLHPDFVNLRRFYFTYHRHGLDIMSERPGTGRKIITEALPTLKVVHERRPASFTMQMFFDAKVGEVVDMYKPAPYEEKQQVFDILNLIDPGHLTQFQQMMD